MAIEEGWVSVEEVATHLRVARESIYRWVETKSFPAHRVGRLFRFKLSEVDEWVKNSGAGDRRSDSDSKLSPMSPSRLRQSESLGQTARAVT